MVCCRYWRGIERDPKYVYPHCYVVLTQELLSILRLILAKCDPMMDCCRYNTFSNGQPLEEQAP